ncbi:MAG: sensor histidine kinase [Pleurocapsa sp.]
MYRLKKYLTSPHLSWRLIEWILIFANFPTIFFFGNDYTVRPERIKLDIVFALIFWLLSFVFPINHSILQKRFYIAIEIGLINIALFNGIGLDILMYFILAKACFILPRKDAIITIIITGITTLGVYAHIVPILQAEAREYIRLNGTEDLFDSLGESLLDYSTEYIAVSFFLTLFMFLLVAESKSRKRAENLAEEVEILATVVERNRIAREIHDSLGRTLTTLGVQLELAQKLHGINSSRSTQALQNAQQLATQSLSEVRNTISAIRDENFNLERALKSLINQFRQDQLFDIQAQFNLPNIPLQTSHQVYCIVKEALYNIQKHSRANLVTINSKVNTNNITIEIADNGIGFNPERINYGSGLKGMIERSQLINSQLKIDTAVDQGTRIQLVINN